MALNEYDVQTVTKEQLIDKINELELLNDALIDEKEQETRINFPWAGNLGHWYWNISCNKVTFNHLKITNLGYSKEEIPDPVPYQFFTSKLHPDDYQNTMNAMIRHLDGTVDIYETEYRIQTKKGTYKWYYDRGKVTKYDAAGRPQFLAGIVFDVTWKKQQEERMELRASQDPLTQLYTKDKAADEIDRSLRENAGKHTTGLLVMDIDHFRAVNVANGHMFGDTILQTIADILRRFAGSAGITARIGGDEFLLCLPACDEASFNMTALRLHEEIYSLYISEERSRRLSASIGVTLSAAGNSSQLLNNAFSALYHAKQTGLNSVSIYEDLPKPDVSDGLMHTISNIRPHDNWERENIISFSLRTAEQVMDIKSALHVLYSRIARQYGVDQICVTGAGDHGKASSNLYCWTARDSFIYDPEKLYLDEDVLQRRADWLRTGNVSIIDRKAMEEMDQNFRRYLHNQKMGSQLICPVWVQGIYQGSLVYSSLNANRTWDDATVQVLKELSNIQYATICKVNAESSNRAKTEFLSHMSHEIRTPLNSIIGMIEIAKNCMEDAGRVAYCLAKIDGASHYLLSLISNVLEMSKIENNDICMNEEVFSIRESLSAVRSLMGGVVGKDQKLEYRVNCSHDFVRGDNVSLQQVLTNLSVNSIKFTPEDGEILICAEELKTDYHGRGLYRFSVTDNGIGIAEKDLKRIFQRFEQVEETIPNQYSGTGLGGVGLGLAISDKLVRLMGGKIEVKSKPGAGSCFSFILDLPEADIPSRRGTGGALIRALEGKTILIVEDNEWNIEVARDLLEMRGATVLLARNGMEGVHAFELSSAGQISAILMDIRMPVMDGIEAARRIRQMDRPDRNVPIIAVTSNAFDEDSYKTLEDGMDAHLTKPVEGARLCKTILHCLARNQQAGGQRLKTV